MDNWVSFLPRYHQYAAQKLGVLWDRYNWNNTLNSLKKNPLSTWPAVTMDKMNMKTDKQKKRPQMPVLASQIIFISSFSFTAVFT